MDKYIFQIKLSRLLSIFFLLLGGVFFFAGMDMLFLHKVIPVSTESGFKFAAWFSFIIGSLVGSSGIQNCISPMTLIKVNHQGVNIKSTPGPTRKLTLISWEAIANIEQGEIVMHSGKGGGRTVHKTVKFVLNPESPLANSRITDGMVRWSSKEINFDSIYFTVKLDELIAALLKIKTNPNSFEQMNLAADYFIKHNK